MIRMLVLAAVLAGLPAGAQEAPAPAPLQLTPVAPITQRAARAQRPPARRPPAADPAPTADSPSSSFQAMVREPAPVPNRSLERIETLAEPLPSLSPMLIPPRNGPESSVAIGPGHVTLREDRLYREPAAGAMLRVPFAY